MAAAFPSPRSSGDTPTHVSSASRSRRRRVCWGQVVFSRGASGLGRLGGGVPTRLPQNRFVLHLEGLRGSSVGVVRAEGVGPGVLAGGRAAHLLVALLVGVVARVGRLLAALAAVGALRGKDLLGWRRHGSGSQMLFIPQDRFAGFIQAGSTLILKTQRKLGLKSYTRGDLGAGSVGRLRGFLVDSRRPS